MSGVVVLAAAVAILMTSVRSVAVEPCGQQGYTSAGCTLYSNHQPVVGDCSYSPGSSCYKCEYVCSDENISTCGESHDGDVKKCEISEEFRDM
jgi:hypothetical protein